MTLNNQVGPVPPSGPFQPTKPIAEAMILAARTLGVSDAELQALAKRRGVEYSHIANNLRKGPRMTERQIGKNGCQWDYEQRAGRHYIRNLRWTPDEEMRKREKYGMVRGSQKLREAKV
jgi:hypothetical protein